MLNDEPSLLKLVELIERPPFSISYLQNHVDIRYVLGSLLDQGRSYRKATWPPSPETPVGELHYDYHLNSPFSPTLTQLRYFDPTIKGWWTRWDSLVEFANDSLELLWRASDYEGILAGDLVLATINNGPYAGSYRWKADNVLTPDGESIGKGLPDITPDTFHQLPDFPRFDFQIEAEQKIAWIAEPSDYIGLLQTLQRL